MMGADDEAPVGRRGLTEATGTPGRAAPLTGVPVFLKPCMTAKTPTEIAALDSYTHAEMLKLVRWAIATLVSGPQDASATINGETYTIQDIEKLNRLERHYAARAAEDAADAELDDAGSPVVEYQGP